MSRVATKGAGSASKATSASRPSSKRVATRAVPLDLARPTFAGAPIVHAPVKASKPPRKTARKAPVRGAAVKGRRAASSRGPSSGRLDVRLRRIVAVAMVVAGLWFVPAFAAQATFVPTPLYMLALAVFGVCGWAVAGQGLRAIAPAMLAAVATLWAGAVVPELISGTATGALVPVWPAPPRSEAAALVWRIVALLLLAGLAAVPAFALATTSAPAGRGARR